MASSLNGILRRTTRKERPVSFSHQEAGIFYPSWRGGRHFIVFPEKQYIKNGIKHGYNSGKCEHENYGPNGQEKASKGGGSTIG